MSRLSNSPRTQRGAIVAISSDNPVPVAISFQYNPETLTRNLQPNTAGKGAAKTEIPRVDVPPTETIDLTAEFDATDGLEANDPVAVSMGIYPQLSALEMLLYPPKSRAISNNILAALGALEIIPPIAPLTLFVWGPKRVVPVQFGTMSIKETAYDDQLNPIQASVTLKLTVLSNTDFCGADIGGNIFLAHQGIKEAMGLIGTAASVVSFF